MAISVSYLSDSLHPDWSKFSNQLAPHKSGNAPVSEKGGEPWKSLFGHKWGPNYFSEFRKEVVQAQDPLGGEPWITIFQQQYTPHRYRSENAQPQKPLGGEPWKSIHEGSHVIKTERVESKGANVFLDVLKGQYSGPKHTNPWAEIGQIRWEMTIDDVSLGPWAKLDGLGMKVEMVEHRTGDGANYRWIDPTYTTYPTLKLTRAASAAGCAAVLAWIEAVQFGWKRGVTAQITGVPLESWAEPDTYFTIGLVDVMPVAWTGPQFNAEGKYATEVLEIAHSGFLSEIPTKVPPVVPAGPPPRPPKPVAEFTFQPVERNRTSMMEAAGYSFEMEAPPPPTGDSLAGEEGA